MNDRHHYAIHMQGVTIAVMARDVHEAMELYGVEERDVAWVKEDGRVIIPTKESVDTSARFALSLIML